MILPSPVGARVRELREAAELSARELDRLAKITPGHTSALETRTQTVTAEILSRIARVFGASLDWLANGDGQRPTDDELRASVRRASEASLPATGT